MIDTSSAAMSTADAPADEGSWQLGVRGVVESLLAGRRGRTQGPEGSMNEFEAILWRETGRTVSWTLVSLPTDLADYILDLAGPFARGFGSLRVDVTIGDSNWRTSIFPDSKRGTYVLPIKEPVRRAQGLAPGDTAHVRLRLVDL
jgi:hypothetical protein